MQGHIFFYALIFFFLTPWAGQARLAGQANLAALAPAGPIWSTTAGGLARQALPQYGCRRLHGKRDGDPSATLGARQALW